MHQFFTLVEQIYRETTIKKHSLFQQLGLAQNTNVLLRLTRERIKQQKNEANDKNKVILPKYLYKTRTNG